VHATVLTCPQCRTPVPDARCNTGTFAPCPSCGRQLQCEVFPAFHGGPRIGRPGEAIVDATDASCFFHPDKRAAVACESCGRFLCALCDLDFAGQHICPTCLASGRKKGTLGSFDHFRVSWTGIALVLSIVPLVIFYPISIVTAPAAIVVALLGLRKPPSLTGRRRVIAFSLAMIFSLAEIGAWFWFGGALVKSFYGGN
jgi:hypothetical protein